VLDALASETGRSVPQLRGNLGAVEVVRIARFDAASTVPPLYPTWYQRMTMADRSPPPVR